MVRAFVVWMWMCSLNGRHAWLSSSLLTFGELVGFLFLTYRDSQPALVITSEFVRFDYRKISRELLGRTGKG